MLRISLITPNSGDACSLYRGLGPYMQLPGIKLKTFSGAEGFLLWEAIMSADVCVLQRPCTEQQVGIASTIKACGKKLIVDWDDNLTCLPDWNPHRADFEGCQPFVEAISKLADVVTVSSKALVASAKQWGAKQVVLVPNAIDDTFKRLPKRPRTTNMVWRGGTSHVGDLLVGKPLIESLAATHKIVFVGDKPDWACMLRDTAHYGVMDYANYIAVMNMLAPEFVVVPLADHPFNYAKSDIGAQEAYLIGAKLIHNGIGEYKGLPEVGTPRWLSETNAIRTRILRSLV